MKMSWRDDYKSRLATADKAVKLVSSGDTVVPSHACGEPKPLLDALVRRADELRNVEIWTGLNHSGGEYCAPEVAESFHINTTFPHTNTRKSIWENRGMMTPIPFYLFPKAFYDKKLRVDGYFAHVSPPDDNGYVSFGISVDMARANLEMSSYSVAYVNPNMPRTCGDTLAHVSQFTAIVEGDFPLLEIPKIDDSDPDVDRIGQNIANIIEDGDCLQMGQGKMPNAILKCLDGKKDLGIHTEVFSDNLIPLIEKGVITGAKKTVIPRKIVACFIQGSRNLYKYVHQNQMLQMMPVNFTNDPAVICRMDNMVSINSALEVDMMGQVAAESQGPRQYSGVGGQLDFFRGAAAAKNGRAILALPSTAKGGTMSRISAVLPAGTPITTTRNDVHWVVTEQGAVNLFGQPINRRAKLLLQVAHPKFRESLERDFWNYCKGNTF
jgi:4-hydroxybutyrate CoA-transferase